MSISISITNPNEAPSDPIIINDPIQNGDTQTAIIQWNGGPIENNAIIKIVVFPQQKFFINFLPND